MTLDSQKQTASGGAQAIQAGGDVSISNGLTADQMIEIMSELAAIATRFTVTAMVEVDRRVNEFREEIIERFIKDKQADTEAFRDPDFQYMLGDAQTAYARSGEPAVRDTLIDIIARRSMVASATREALALNDAAARAPRLTKSEFASLSLNYLVRYTHNGVPNCAATFAGFINNDLMPFVRDASKEESSFWHISSQSCASVSLSGMNLRDYWSNIYGGLLGYGFEFEAVRQIVPDSKVNSLNEVLCPSVRSFAKFQPKAVNKVIFKRTYSSSGLSNEELDAIWSLHADTIPPEDVMIEMLKERSPDVGELFDLWRETPIKSMELNSVGIAIAHANAVRVIGFGVPLKEWIK